MVWEDQGIRIVQRLKQARRVLDVGREERGRFGWASE